MGKNDTKYTDRQQWFIDRVGKRVFREDNECDCDLCRLVTKEGLVISDVSHALYLAEIEFTYKYESDIDLNYRDEL